MECDVLKNTPDSPITTKSGERKSVLKNKVFVQRNSIIEDIMENEHAKPIYSMFIAIIMGLVVHTAANDYFYKGRINFGQRLIIAQFSTFHTFWLLWIPIFLSNFLVYYSFICWAIVRTSLPPKSVTKKLWDYFWLGLTITYYPGWLYLVTCFALKQDISLVMALAMHAEITRMLMKMHAFLRSNIPRVLSYKLHAEHDVLHPSFTQFMYFLWAPTLIYRDTYPRTKSIRWCYVIRKAIEFLVTLTWMSVLFERYFVHNFNEYGIKPYSWTDITVITIGNAGGGLMLMIAAIYILLHVWHNGFAEICKFGDRMFYEDWWCSTDYERYYRTWNQVVHDWLYTYVYKDFYEIIVPGKRIVAKYAVFLISAIFHEYILGFSFRFFLPIVFIQFVTIGTIMTYVKMKPFMVGNVFLLYTLGIGNAINGTFLSLEYYSRLNCPIENPTLYSNIVPRLFSCSPNQV